MIYIYNLNEIILPFLERDLHAIDGEKTAEDAFLEAGAENDDVVLLIHFNKHLVCVRAERTKLSQRQEFEQREMSR